MNPPGPLPLTKAIPPARDRLQSRLLVWMMSAAFVYQGTHAPTYLMGQARLAGPYLESILAISMLFALLAWKLRAATPWAASLGGVVCLFVTAYTSVPGSSSPLRSALTPLVLLFLLTLQATRLGRSRKVAAGLAEGRRGRDAAQIVANLGVAALASSPDFRWRVPNWFASLGNFGYSGPEGHQLFVILCSIPALAALAEATADTVSSEIGQAFGGTPRMLLTLRPAAPGTDGAITLLGTAAGIAAAALIALTGIPALGMSLAQCGIAFGAGVAGLFFDSLLGATLERRGWLGNDLVNFFSTAFAAAFSLLVVRLTLA